MKAHQQYMPPCKQISKEFTEYLRMLKVRHASKAGVFKPSSGFLLAFLAIQMCATVDLYGFQLCDRSLLNYGPDRDFTAVMADVSKRPNVIGNEVIVDGRNDTHYYCNYANEQHNKIHAYRHTFELEHELLDKLAQCGLLKVWQ